MKRVVFVRRNATISLRSLNEMIVHCDDNLQMETLSTILDVIMADMA